MANIYNLPLVGVIGDNLKYTDVLLHLNAAKSFDGIRLLIDSVGGEVFEGDKIRDALVDSGKVWYSENIGNVCSYATRLFCIAPKENRQFNPTKGEFVIHNPYQPANTIDIDADADTLKELSDSIKKDEIKSVKEYSNSTGSDENIIAEFMRANEPLTPEQIEKLGFATIVQPEHKAVAYFNFKKMDNKEVIEKLSGFEKILQSFTSKFKFKQEFTKQDVKGTELVFSDPVVDETGIVEGVSVTANGQPADGEYIMADGKVLVATAGKVVSFAMPVDANMEALKIENENLKASLEAANLKTTELTTQLTAQKTEFENVQKAFKEVKQLFKVDVHDNGQVTQQVTKKEIFKRK